MGARILVQSGVAAGTEMWIEQAVIRIGSDPAADLSLPSILLAPHAVTVEFRDNSYRVYNRSTGNIYLGGQALAAGRYDQWLDSDILELGDGIQLALELDDDPSPSRRGFDDPYRQVQSDAQGDATDRPEGRFLAEAVDQDDKSRPPHQRSSSGQTGLYLGVTLACVIGSVLLLARHNMKATDGAASNTAPSFAQVIAEAQASDNVVDPRLVSELQYAEALVVRRASRQARERYQRLHEALLRGDQQAGISQNSSPVRDDIKRLVEARLRKLSEY